MDDDRFVRERAEVYEPSIMTYGDSEGINRYLGLGSLRSVSNPVTYEKKQVKSSNICWRFNGMGRCIVGLIVDSDTRVISVGRVIQDWTVVRPCPHLIVLRRESQLGDRQLVLLV